MRLISYTIATISLASLTACGGGAKDQVAKADSALLRDKTLLPADSTRPLADTFPPPPAAVPAPAPERVAPGVKPAAPRPKPKPAPVATRNSEPVAAPATPGVPLARTLEAGKTFEAALAAGISSRVNKAGEELEATVNSDVVDANGRTVIPAGSRVTLRIADLGVSENKGDKTGKLLLTPVRVTIAGKSSAIDGSASVASYLKGRKANIGDAAKVGAGVGIGAIAGKIIGGGKGAVIGGLVGGAVGTQRAIETADRDVIVDEGSPVTIKLSSDFTKS